MDEIAERLKASFARQTMMTTLGAELVETGAGRAVIAAPVGPHVLQQHGAGHAALAFAIGDSAAGYSALSLMPDGAEVMTVEMKINLLAPAVGDRLVAEGRVIKSGRRIAVVAADVWSETAKGRKHIAMLQGTMIPVTP
ncbi:PaaI family thioesterase [uncultured Paracoccus sp.]|uniref:PaaI family thioesterase n=1 Tax=uncultured Paracoccus sp. TaxID=189685 RepID=UPI00260B2F09|nr:PaaI family thioesterase [uncultured Paracoccus sp.]